MEDKPRQRVAVVGAGSSGLAMLKQLRDDGFATTLFERRAQVGGLWAYTDDPTMTSALATTGANISKYTCGFSDYAMPDKYPPFLSQPQFQEFMEEYAQHYDLHRDIVFNARVKRIVRSADGSRWRVEMTVSGKEEAPEFDKVVLCHGYQTKPEMPDFVDRQKFTSEIVHSMGFRNPDSYAGKNVLVVGLGATASDVIPVLAEHTKKLYVSHRRGALIVNRWLNGRPADLNVSYARRKMGYFMQSHFPRLAARMADLALYYLAMRKWEGKLDPSWGLENPPSITLSISHVDECVIPLLQDGRLVSKPGISRFLGPKQVEFTDGSTLDDIDAIVCCTGYTADFSLTPFVEFSRPEADVNGKPYGGAPMARLYMNLFPPAHADSIAILAYSQFGKNNGFSFSDVTAMAVSNIFRGASTDMVPARPGMERAVDAHHRWVASRWQLDHTLDLSAVKQWEFQGFLHRAAGTGMENLGWGWKGWWFWLRDPKLSYLMNHGVETAHAFRFFETGKRKTWPGAREAIIHMNELVKEFPHEKKE